MTRIDTEKELIKTIDADIEINQISINGYNINYAKAGSGPPLLLIHGANFGWGAWYPNISEFAKYFTVYAIDLPGAGRSTRIDYAYFSAEEVFVDVVDSFIKTLHLKKVTIMGHSIGGWIGLKLAIKKATYLRSIIVVNSLGFSKSMPIMYRLISFRPVAKFFAEKIMFPTRKNIKKFLESSMYGPFVFRQEFINYVYDAVVHKGISHPLMFLNSFMKPLRLKQEFILIKQLSCIKNPVLVVVSDKDPLTPISDIFRAIEPYPIITSSIISGAGHAVHLEKPQELNAITMKFLKSIKKC